MRKIASALLLLVLAAPAFAQSGTPAPTNDTPVKTAQVAPKKSLYICWYRSDGQLTGSARAGEEIALHDPLPTDRGGKKAWLYEIRSVSGKSCPVSLFGDTNL